MQATMLSFHQTVQENDSVFNVKILHQFVQFVSHHLSPGDLLQLVFLRVLQLPRVYPLLDIIDLFQLLSKIPQPFCRITICLLQRVTCCTRRFHSVGVAGWRWFILSV
ncbi:hypothetical protein NP493_4150g00000 [Ridgeia piscesae]|uniref:Uncharacterized protein n=1 Tax=Ridgeia piscesae TaxID=27915 RepID=A0AAD9MSZ1_RIDPI|nr:hypothetical protein NP493_4150g00000 [Ridgeia piscesae]